MLLYTTILITALIGAIWYSKGALIPQNGQSLNGATFWLNSEPLSLSQFRGKVVLIDFWTYTCINWRRTLPYRREWASKYKDQGLVVIGIHTPEFLFEHQIGNIRRSIEEMNITYPVAIDNNFGIWNSFRNTAWPALYLIDAKGRLRYQKLGENGYYESEVMIQQLLQEVSPEIVFDEPVSLQSDGAEASPDWENLRSPENFLGYARTERFVSPGGVNPDKQKNYAFPEKLKLNQWALSGEWIYGPEHVLLKKELGKIIYSFHARDLHLIMGPATPDRVIKFRVLIDGKPPGESHGIDVDANGNGTVIDQRMYQLIRQQGPIIDHAFQIEFLDAEVEVYDFTFG